MKTNKTTFKIRQNGVYQPFAAIFSLRFILNVPFALILVLSIGLISYFSFQNSTSTVNDVAKQLLAESSARVNQYLDSYLAMPSSINNFNEDSIRLEFLNNNGSFERQFLAQMQRFEQIAAITWATEDSVYLRLTRDNLGADLIFAQSSEQANPTFEVYKTNFQAEHGLVIDSFPNYDPRTQSWYQTAASAGQSTWTPIFVRSREEGIGLDAVKPIYRESGDLLGILDVSLYLSEIGKFLRTVPISQQGSIFIVDENGSLVALSTNAEPFTNTNNEIVRLDALSSSDSQVQSAAKAVIGSFTGWSSIEDSQQLSFDWNGERQLVQVTPYQNAGLQWWVAIVMPESSFVASINEHNRFVLLLIGASLLLSIGMVSLVAHWITMPILQLSQAAKNFAAGNLSERPVINRGDELGELASSFNQMAGELEKSVALLQASESRLRAIFENSADAILVSRMGLQLTANPAYLTMFAYENPDSFVGKPILDMIAPNEHSRVSEYVRRRSQGELAPIRYETLGIKQDGTIFNMEVLVSSYYQNTDIYSVAILRDISEYKEAEKALVKSTELLAQQKYILTERLKELNCLYEHSKFLEMSDISIEDLCRGTVNLIPPAWQYPDVTCARIKLEDKLYTTDNFKVTVWQQASPIILDGQVIGILEVYYLEERAESYEGAFLKEERLLIDELARRLGHKIKALQADFALKKAYETLEQKVIERTAQLTTAKDRVEAVLNHSVDGILLIHPDFSIRQSNTAFDKLFAAQPNAYLGRYLSELFCTAADAPSFSSIESRIAEGLDLYIAIRARRWDGTVFDAELGIGHIKGEGLVCVVRDITTRKHAEDVLRQTLAKEKELGELKTRFVSMASHEFRTPLATILALSESLDAYRHKMEEYEIEECLGQVKAQVAHLKELIEEVLLLARIQARRHEFKPVKQNINELLRTVLDEFQNRADIKHHLYYISNQENHELFLDTKLIRQVINNLLSNAIKYSPEDKPIQIRLECFPHECILSFRDYGIGIPEDDLKHLFEPFHRASNVGTIPGTGLGLVISKESIELHGGEITVESHLNLGTVFLVRIPVIKDGENKDEENIGN